MQIDHSIRPILREQKHVFCRRTIFHGTKIEWDPPDPVDDRERLRFRQMAIHIAMLCDGETKITC